MELEPGSPEAQEYFDNQVFVDARSRFARAFMSSPQYAAQQAQIEAEMMALVFDGVFAPMVALSVGSMDAPMAALRNCVEDLLTSRGIDAVAHKSLLRGVEMIEPEAWVSRITRNFVVGGLSPSWRGYFWLDISAEGEVTSCHLQTQLDSPKFEAKVCRNLARLGRFAPALDADGMPIASYIRISTALPSN